MPSYNVKVGQKCFTVDLLSRTQSSLRFSIEGNEFQVEIAPVFDSPSPGLNQRVIDVTPNKRALTPAALGNANNAVCAPMPGIIVQVNVAIGEEVKIGQCLLVIEAMKMENNLSATRAGKIKRINVSVGQEVNNGQVLVELE